MPVDPKKRMNKNQYEICNQCHGTGVLIKEDTSLITMGCMVNAFSSRVCELGTRCCVLRHQTVKVDDVPCYLGIKNCSIKHLIDPAAKKESVQVWQVFEQSDMTEGRGSLVIRDSKVYATEQEAWDSINHLGGVMGRRQGVNCWPVDKLKESGVTTWQGYKPVVGYPGDYDVCSILVEKSKLNPLIDLCRYCDLPIGGGKGDYWHQGSGEFMGPDGHLAYPKIRKEKDVF